MDNFIGKARTGAAVLNGMNDRALAATQPLHEPSILAGLYSTASSASWPQLDEEMIEAAARVLHSGKLNYWTGSEGRLFEKEFAEYVGCNHAVAVANGTVALELALIALGIGPGDEVVVPSRTFMATASAVARCGATPVFADVDRNSQNVTAETIRAQLTDRSRAVIAVHLAGWPCDVDPIMELARERDLWVIEDCAQAHGARYKGCPIGSLGDIAAFSFCQDKIITTGGEGGMVVTNRPELAERAWSFKDHGKNFAKIQAPAGSTGFRWLHDSIGTNWRLTEMQSAIGRVALQRLNDWVFTRRANAGIFDEELAQVPVVRIATPPPSVFHSYYKWYAFVRPERLADGWSRDRIISEITRLGVPCFSGSCSEIYLEKAFDSAKRPTQRLPNARELGETSLMFLVHPTLSEEHVRVTAELVRGVLERAAGQYWVAHGRCLAA
jgi:dTDP-4-amino-4,6-dideoxygalactose transaminase